MPRTPDPQHAEEPQSSKAKPQSTRTAPRRTREPQWTKLKPTIAYLYETINDRLTNALQATGMGLQDAFEIAINQYCDSLHPPIPAKMPEDADLKVPRDPNLLPGTPLDQATAPAAVVRLQPNTRARLVAACHQENMGGKGVLNDVIEAYLNELTLEQ